MEIVNDEKDGCLSPFISLKFTVIFPSNPFTLAITTSCQPTTSHLEAGEVQNKVPMLSEESNSALDASAVYKTVPKGIFATKGGRGEWQLISSNKPVRDWRSTEGEVAITRL